MRHTVIAMLALLLGGTIASAQGPARTAKVKADNGTVITLNGCVMIGGATSYLLTNLKGDSSGTTAAKGDTAAGSYALIGRDGVDLSAHINQQVELTGVLVRAATRGDHDDKFTVKEPAGTTKVKVARGPANQFLVATVKTVAPACAP